MKYHALQIFVPMQLLQNLHVMLGCRQGEGSGGSVVTLPPMHFFASFCTFAQIGHSSSNALFCIFLHTVFMVTPELHLLAPQSQGRPPGCIIDESAAMYRYWYSYIQVQVQPCTGTAFANCACAFFCTLYL